MYTPSSRSAGKGDGGERLDVPGNLGMSEIQHQLTVLARQMWQLALRFTDSERQRMEEAANAAAIQAARKAEEERRNGREVQEWKARMSSSHAVQGAFEGSSGTTAAGRLSTVMEKQEQGEAAGYVLLTGPSGGPDYRREPTRRELLDRLGQNNGGHFWR